MTFGFRIPRDLDVCPLLLRGRDEVVAVMGGSGVGKTDSEADRRTPEALGGHIYMAGECPHAEPGESSSGFAAAWYALFSSGALHGSLPCSNVAFPMRDERRFRRKGDPRSRALKLNTVGLRAAHLIPSGCQAAWRAAWRSATTIALGQAAPL